MSADLPQTPPPVFQAVIAPYRSLTRKGVITLLAVLSFFTALIIARFWLLGAWPVVLFSGIEVPLVIVLLWVNMRRARVSEMILLNPTELRVTRTDWAGRRTVFSLPAAWLRVDHDTAHGASRVLLRSRGVVREIGGFLHEEDREALYHALAEAMHTVRNPLFDNPQLRDEPDA